MARVNLCTMSLVDVHVSFRDEDTCDVNHTQATHCAEKSECFAKARENTIFGLAEAIVKKL